ncbi:MAG: hypothetical protein RLZZ618_81 [Pseudomonadota bacterium]|jgi:membrane associated rhomboid family serine protease
MPPISPITQALMLINVGMFCLTALFPAVLGPLALWPVGPNLMPWQPVSYAFLHGSFNHLFFNMLALWMFGSELERLWGPKRFIQFYAASVLAAAATQLVIGLIGISNAPTVGASGGVYGLLLGYGVVFANRTIMLIIPPIPMKAKTYVMVFGAIELLLGVFGSNQGVAHFAHLGGMLGAWLMILYWRGRLPFGKRR